MRVTVHCKTCGGGFIAHECHIRRGKSQFCSRQCAARLQATKHGLSAIPTYGIWEAMRARCFNESCKEWVSYGARGITVCERWNDFGCFYSDMGPRPDGMSIDRIDNDGNYEPGNCRWATRREQSLNTSRNVRIEFNGQVHVLDEWAAILGIHKATLASRFRYGWSVEKAFTEPVSMKYSHA